MQRTKSKEKHSKPIENNIALTSEKCPEMTQSMLHDEQLVKNIEPESEYYLKRALNLGFQELEIEDFSSVFDNSRRLKEQKGPQYRKINTYYKSKSKYWRERNRRKKAWELSGQGFNYKQIAEKLGVSEKTVQRDIKKIQPYYLRLSQKYFRELEQQRDDELNAELEGKTVFQQFNILTKKMIAYKFLMKQREYRRHSQIILVDMTQLEYGIPKISFIPRGKQTLTYPYKIRVHVKANFDGKDFVADIGGFDIVQKTRNLW